MLNVSQTQTPRLRPQPLPVAAREPTGGTAAAARVQTRALDVFESAAPKAVRALAVAPSNADGLKTWTELSADQQALFGAAGVRDYAALSTDQRSVFLLLTTRMAAEGVDFGGLTLDRPTETIRRMRLLFQPDAAGLERFQSSIERNIADGRFFEDPVFPLFHQGMSDFGAREDRFKWTMQFGAGEKGAFMDMDRFNYKENIWGWLGHAAEIIDPRRPSAFKIAEELGVDLKSHPQSEAVRSRAPRALALAS